MRISRHRQRINHHYLTKGYADLPEQSVGKEEIGHYYSTTQLTDPVS